MARSPEEVMQRLRQEQYDPLYLLQGEEPFFIDQIAGHIEAHALDEAEKGFNLVVLYGKDQDVATVLNHARRFPMMAPRQVVIVREAQELPDLNRPAAQQLLEAYARQPVPTTVLVLCHKHKTIDGRRSLGKALSKHATVVNARKVYDNKLPGWIERYLQPHGHRIDPPATQLLADNIGADLSRLAKELDKLRLNLPAGTTITPALVQRYVGISKDFNVFELQHALVRQDAPRAHQIANYFAADPRAHPLIPIVAVLFGFFCKVLRVHLMPRATDEALAKALGVNKFFVRDYRAASRRYSLPRTTAAIGYLRQADLRAKGIAPGTYAEGDILRELIAHLL